VGGNRLKDGFRRADTPDMGLLWSYGLSSMRRFVVSVGVGISLLAIGLVWSTPVSGAPRGKVTICHRTSSVRNPYVQNTVNVNSIVTPNGTPVGHGTHTGPVYPTPGWGDIIRPFAYTNASGGTSTYPGMNWSGQGQAIWNGGCAVDLTTEPPAEPPPTTTTPPTTSTPTTSTPTTPTPTTPTTSTPTTPTPTAATTTTTPPATTTTPPTNTTALPGTPPTAAPSSERPPPPVDPPNGAEITPPVVAETIDPGAQAVHLGSLTTDERVTLETELDPVPSGAPPAGLGGASTSNGFSVDWAVAGGIFLLLAGLASYWAWRRRSAP
jgi:hypothetical protein